MSEGATRIEAPTSVLRPRTSVLVDGLHVTYRVFAERKPSLRQFVARGFRRREYQEVKAIRGVDFTARAGEALGVIGRNGSGKSTLLRTIAGLLKPTSGAVYARSVPILLGVASALQSELNARRNVILGGTALGFSREELEGRVDEIIRFAGVEEFSELPLKAYSSGMRARLEFSIASSVDPDVLLIDETLAVGDAEFKRKSERRIQELVGGAGTVIMVSHALSVIRDACSRVIWLDQGRIIEDGDPVDVVDAYIEATEGSEED